MLAASDQGDAEMLTIIITNAYTTSAPSRTSVTLAADASLASLHEAVASSVGFVASTFELHKTDGTVHAYGAAGADATTLAEALITNKCRLRLQGVDGGFPTPVDPAAPTGNAAAALGTVALWSASQGHSSAAYGPVARAAAAKPLSNADGFRGLVNQGATCYLSSVVQSLYMTPEFRAAIYALGGPPTAEIGSGGAEAAPIAWTLQELFVHLQTSEQTAVETRALTASFGWASADSFEQVAGVG